MTTEPRNYRTDPLTADDVPRYSQRFVAALRSELAATQARADAAERALAYQLPLQIQAADAAEAKLAAVQDQVQRAIGMSDHVRRTLLKTLAAGDSDDTPADQGSTGCWSCDHGEEHVGGWRCPPVGVSSTPDNVDSSADDIHCTLPKDHVGDCKTEADRADTPDLMAALRASVEEANARRVQPSNDEPRARCSHPVTTWEEGSAGVSYRYCPRCGHIFDDDRPAAVVPDGDQQ